MPTSRVANNPVSKRIFDRTKIWLALPGLVLCDIGQPHVIDAFGGVNGVVASYALGVCMGKQVFINPNAWTFGFLPAFLPIR